MLSYLKSPVKNVKKYQPVNGLKDLFVNVASFFMNLKFDRASLFFLLQNFSYLQPPAVQLSRLRTHLHPLDYE